MHQLHHRSRLLAIAALLFLLAAHTPIKSALARLYRATTPGAAWQSNCTILPITIGQIVGGTISSSDCPSPIRSSPGQTYYADRYSFTGTAGTGVSISYQYFGTSMYLILLSPSGATLSQGSGIPSSGFINLPASGTYIIEISASSSFNTGAYRLSLTAGTAGCNYALSTTSQTVAAGAGTGSLNVTAGAACAWTALSDTDWLTITAGNSATGSGAVSYSAAANPTPSTRTGTLLIAGQYVSITQLGDASNCNLTSISVGQVAGGTISSSDCPSPIRSSPGQTYYADRYSFTGTAGTGVSISYQYFGTSMYLILLSPSGATLSQGSGIPSSGFINLPASGTYIIEISASSSFNTGAYRLSLTAGTAGCNYALSTTSQTVAAGAGTGSLNVTAGAACAWTALSDTDWLTITAGNSATGSGAVSYSAAANPTPSTRTGTLLIAGQYVSITQLGDASNCNLTSISVGQVVGGTISSSDCPSPIRSSPGQTYYADRYSFTGTAGTGVSISYQYFGTSMYLILLSPSGATLSQGSGIPSSGFINLPASGTYIIEISASSSFNTGAYRLSLTAGTAGCNYALSTTSQTVAAGAGTGSLNVTAGAACAWTALSDTDWLTITAGNSATGSGAVSYSAAANPTPSTRTGTLLIAGQYVSITQLGDASNCNLTSISVGQVVGGTISSSDCPSPIRSSPGQTYYADRYSFTGTAGTGVSISYQYFGTSMYLILLSPSGATLSQGSGIPSSGFINLPASGTYIIEISASSSFNTGAYRLSLTAGTAGCNYALSTTSQTVAAGAGTGSLNVTAGAACAWTALSDTDWLTITAGNSATGSGAVSYSAAANTSFLPRSTTLIIAGQYVSVIQLGNGGACAVIPITVGQPVNGALSSSDCFSPVRGDRYYADRYSFNSTAGNKAAISYQSSAFSAYLYLLTPSGLVLAEGSRIPSSGFVNLPENGTYLVEVTSSSNFSTGSYSVSLNVCTYSITPMNQTFGATSGTGNVTVTTGSECSWTTSSNASWVQINSGNSGTGNGTVNFTVAANSGTARTGTITVAGQTFTVTQAGAQPNPVPAIASISPNAVIAGAAAFTLTVNGMNFVGGSVVRVNGSDRMTTVVSATQVTAAIPAADIAAAGAARIAVFNPTPGGGLSNEVLLAINSPVTSVSAASFLSALGLAPESIVSAFGTRLATATQVATTQPLPTTIAGTTVRIRDNAGAEQLAPLFFVAPTQINYQLPANIANGPATVTVTSGDGSVSIGTVQVATVAPGLFAANANGQGVAAGLALRVRNPNPVPAISSLSPSSAVAGGPGFTLTANGANFVVGSVLRWNGGDRATTVVSGTQVRAAIPAADIASTGAAAITVFNPEPGGGASNALNFSINNPVPSIASMSHASTTSGGPGFTLTINGSNFIPASVARWNGSDRATTVVSNSRLMAEITATDIAAAVDGSVTVFNPPPGGGTSASQRIFVFDGNLDVRLTSGVAVTGNFSASPPGACGFRIFPQYTIQVPDGASQLRIALTSSQDLDLFARFAQRVDIPSSIVADYSSRSSGGNETITVTPSSSPPLQAGKYFILVASCSSSAATFSLTATVTGGAVADQPVITNEAQPDTPKPADESVEAQDEDPVFVYFPRPAKSEQDAIEIMAPLWIQRGSLLLLPGNVGITSGPASDSHDYGNGTRQPMMNSSLPAIPLQGTQSFESLVRFDQAQNRFVAVPIDLGPASDDVFLVLYGAGIRLRSSLGMVTARVGGITVPVLFAGATPGLIGLDQINLGPLPRPLTGRGEVDVVLTVDGKVANTVRVSFR